MNFTEFAQKVYDRDPEILNILEKEKSKMNSFQRNAYNKLITTQESLSPLEIDKLKDIYNKSF